MSWSDGGCARAHNPGKRRHVAKAGDGTPPRPIERHACATRLGFNVWAPCELLQRGDGATLARGLSPPPAGCIGLLLPLLRRRRSSFAAFALGASGVGAVNLKVSGASRGFAALMDDLLESLPKRTVLFMAETAVLEHLDASLCEAVTGAGDSGALLDKLEHSYALAESFDSEGCWLRYYQLLRDHLRGPLTQRLQINCRIPSPRGTVVCGAGDVDRRGTARACRRRQRPGAGLVGALRHGFGQEGRSDDLALLAALLAAGVDAQAAGRSDRGGLGAHAGDAQ